AERRAEAGLAGAAEEPLVDSAVGPDIPMKLSGCPRSPGKHGEHEEPAGADDQRADAKAGPGHAGASHGRPAALKQQNEKRELPMGTPASAKVKRQELLAVNFRAA